MSLSYFLIDTEHCLGALYNNFNYYLHSALFIEILRFNPKKIII